MPDQINLKDEKYLKDYENQIRSLPLGELYEVLSIIKKDPSPERMNIVNARIHELENAPKAPKPEKAENPERVSSKKEKPEKVERPKKEKKVKKVQIPAEPVYGHHHRHHKHSPKASILTWIVISLSLATLCVSRAMERFYNEDNFPEDLSERVLTCAMELTPLLVFGVGYMVARSFHRTKKRAVLLGITAFLMTKAALGYFFETYLGFIAKFYDEKAIMISAVVFPVALVLTVVMSLRKTTKPRDAEGLVPLAIALLAETAVYMQLV